MANKYLRTERIPKGYAATDVLKRFKWAKKTHQKIVDKYYNSKFKKLAPTAGTVLTAPADLSWPIINRNFVARITKNLKRLQADNVQMIKLTRKLEKELKDNKHYTKKVAGYHKEYTFHMKNAKNLAKRCVDDYKKCGMQSDTLLFSERQAKKWQGQILKWGKKNVKGNISEDEIKTVKQQIKQLKKLQGKQLIFIVKQAFYVYYAKSLLP